MPLISLLVSNLLGSAVGTYRSTVYQGIYANELEKTLLLNSLCEAARLDRN